jgi:Skp family chaperone for outer membrane proteins
MLRACSRITSQNLRLDLRQIWSRPIEQTGEIASYFENLQLRSGRRWREDGMPKCKVILEQALSRGLPGFGFVAGFIVLTLGVFAGGALAQTEDFKLGVVHIQEVVEGSPDFKRASEEWSRVLTERTAVIQTRQEELREAELLLGGPESPQGDARSELIGRIERLQIDIKRMTTDTQEDLNVLRQRLLDPVIDKVDALVQSYSEENGFDLVLNTSDPNTGMTLAMQDIDFTDELLGILRDAVEEPPVTPDSPGIPR